MQKTQSVMQIPQKILATHEPPNVLVLLTVESIFF